MNGSKLLYVPAGILFGGILALGVSAIAENSELDAGPRVFPYNGVLEFNGEKVNGNVDLEFSLTDEGACNFSEIHDNVAVFSGRFTANIGEVAGDVPTCVFDADEIYIEVAVREADSEGVFTALLGQQRIHPVPFAYWAAEGSDFKVDGNANIGGNANVTGDANITGNANITGATNSGGQITIANNVAESDTVDEISDFQLRLFSNNNATGSFGLGIQASTMFFHAADNAKYRFYENGSTVLMDLAQSGASINTSTTVSGNLTTTGNAVVRGFIQNNTGDVFISDNLDITGDIQDTNGDIILNDNVTITGNLSGLTTRVKHCLRPFNDNANSFDCMCNSGEMVVGGGARSGSRVVQLYNSYPVQVGNLWGWRAACSLIDGSLRACEGAYAICQRGTNNCVGRDFSDPINQTDLCTF